MHKLTMAMAALLATGAMAEGKAQGKGGAKAEDAAREVITKAEAATNSGDTKAFAALLDKDYLGASTGAADVFESAAAMQQHMEKVVGNTGGTVTREKLTMRMDKSGDAAWYIADYTYTPKSGAARKLRGSGVLVRHGKDWKIAMSVMTPVQEATAAK